MILFLWVVAASWLVFLVYWMISAMNAKKNVYSGGRWLGARILSFIVIFLLVRTAFLNHYTTYYVHHATHTALQAIGALLCVVGIALAIWARMHLGRNWGMPRSVKEDPELITTGPYAYVRHPIYSGVLLAALGSAFVDSGWIILLLAYGVYFFYSAEKEEELMQKQFPNEYSKYKKRTKMLIPFLL